MENRHLDDIAKLFQYQDWRFVVVNTMFNIDYIAIGEEWIQPTIRTENDKKTVYLFNGDNHYYFIAAPKTAMFNKYKPSKSAPIVSNCYVCFQSFKSTLFDAHTCQILEKEFYQCDKCTKQCTNQGSLAQHQRKKEDYTQTGPKKTEDEIEEVCPICEANIEEFYSLNCFSYHLLTCNAENDESNHCEICGRNYIADHDCNDWGKCGNCNVQLTSREERNNHRCFFQQTPGDFHKALEVSDTDPLKSTWRSHWVYDFETYRAQEEGEDVYRHEVLAWSIQLVKPNEEIAAFLKTAEYYKKFEVHDKFKGNYTRIGDSPRFHGKSMDSFLRCCTMLTQSQGKRKMFPTFWAHNGAKFDGKFILDYYLNVMKMDLAGVTYEEIEDHKWTTKTYNPKKSAIQLTMVGTRALKIKINNMTFKCSLAHLSGQLRDLPAMFNLETQVEKGEFPYGRLKKENWGKLLPYPTLDEFDLDSKTASRRQEIIEWYEKQDTTQLWDFDKEVWEYLFADVNVLSEVFSAYDAKAKELQQPLYQKYFDAENTRLLAETGIGLHNSNGYVSPLDFATSPAFSLAIYRTWFLPKDIVAVLKPFEEKFCRESLHGGRTDKRCNWIKLENEGDSLQYDDFTSLYPSVQKSSVHGTYYPIGIPHWIRWQGPTTNEELIEKMQGKCGYLRVKTKHKKFTTHPTLSYLGNWDDDSREQKLLFCNSNLDHQVIGWPELEEAIRCGEIDVTHVYEGLLFDRGSVFDEYVDFFFAVKNKAEIDGNKGLRSLAKLLLNSLWGKLGQRSYAIKEWISDAARREYLWDKFEKKEYELVSVVDRSDTRVHVTYRIPDDYTNLNNTACHIAAYVSMWGRVMLHKKVLAVHGARALYCDTDSGVIYLRKGETVPHKGNGLGLLTSEISKIAKDHGYKHPDWTTRITEAVFVVPKTYGMIFEATHKTTGEKQTFTKVICKGFEVSYANAKTVTYKAMKELVFTQYKINPFLNGKRCEEEGLEERSYIPGAKRLTFRSSLESGEVAPREMYIKKSMRGIYTKGRVHPHDPRFIVPFGIFGPPRDTFLTDDKHYE